MKDSQSLHRRVQEMCDCYATSDPLEEMAKLAGEAGDVQEAAVKWLALAVLHGVNSNAEKIALERDGSGRIRIMAHYRIAELPPPNDIIADAVVAAVRQITHIEDKGSLPLAIGIRDSSVDLEVKIKGRDDKKALELTFK